MKKTQERLVELKKNLAESNGMPEEEASRVVDNAVHGKDERLSDRDLAELMGTNRDTYTRRRGAVRKR